MNPHDIVGDFRTTCFAEHGFDFWELQDDIFNLGGPGHGIFQRGTRQSGGFDQQVAFFEAGHELGPQVLPQGNAERQHTQRDPQCDRGLFDRQPQPAD